MFYPDRGGILMCMESMSTLTARKALATRWRGPNHPDTLAADRALRTARLAAAIRDNGRDVLDDAITESGIPSPDVAGVA